MGTFITAATIMAIYLNSAGNLDSRYCYNADVENGRVMTMYVYDKQGLALSGKMEHRYEYDAQGRVTAKETFRRDAVTGRMKPHSRLDYTYTADGYTVERSLWNSGTGAFDRADSRTEYRTAANGVMSVTVYDLAADGSVSDVVDNMLALVPADKGLMAGK